jgi:hypothetical protein
MQTTETFSMASVLKMSTKISLEDGLSLARNWRKDRTALRLMFFAEKFAASFQGTIHEINSNIVTLGPAVHIDSEAQVADEVVIGFDRCRFHHLDLSDSHLAASRFSSDANLPPLLELSQYYLEILTVIMPNGSYIHFTPYRSADMGKESD